MSEAGAIDEDPFAEELIEIELGPKRRRNEI